MHIIKSISSLSVRNFKDEQYQHTLKTIFQLKNRSIKKSKKISKD